MTDFTPRENYVVEILPEFIGARARFLRSLDDGYTNSLERAGTWTKEEAQLKANSYRGEACIRQFKVVEKAIQGPDAFDRGTPRGKEWYERVRELI